MNNNGSSRSEDDLQQGKQTVVSDALAKNSRQLLYAHLYNYLVENQLYDTARILLKEADVPLSNPLEKDGSSSENNEDDEDHDDTNHENSNEMNGIETDGDDSLPGVKMLMTSPDTFLLEWWQSLWALHSYVKETPAIHHQQQQQQQQQQMNPAAAFNPYAANQFIPPQPIQAPVISNSNNSPIDSPASQQQQQQQAANNTTNQQSLQSPLPQSAHGTPHPAQSITAPSPAPNANMIPVQQQQQPPGSAGPTHEHITPQMHHRTPVPPQQQQPQPQPVRQVPTPGSTNPNLPPSVVQQRQQQQQQPPQNQWQYNKMQQQLQAQELQQRVQMQKMQLNNQFNFQNLPPQQQQQFFLQQQQRLQAAQAAAAQANGGGARPNMPQQQIPQQAAAQAQFQQFQQQAGLPIQQQQTGGGNIGSNAGTPTTQHPPQRANPPPPQSNDPNGGLRGDNSTALHDYQMQLMMLENQTKHLPPQAQPNMIPNQQQMMNMQLKNNAMKSRGESIGIDPLQPAVVTTDPLINQQLMDLFNNNGGNSNNNGNNELNGGNTNPNQWQRNGSAGNLGIDELNVDLGVGFPNGGFMNGF